ncbi:MAG: hypothetical protein PHU08_02060 [Dehalococcoidales bacterium]|nr:hypothetical protein [Dehalococcoidales bacterium]
MPQKRTTWIGFIVILAAGIFASWSLFQSRVKFLPTGTRYELATAGAYAAPLVAILAMVLWYYFNEK